MANNINMSEYQKVIFVDNIDEPSLSSQDNTDIKTLSSDYPFAVFFTKFNDDIHNIWHNGKRLTRFIGIDSQNCQLSIGGHVLQLRFNYDTGLLGIYDTNQLGEIEINQITYIDADTHQIVTISNPASRSIGENIINSINNKFDLYVTFHYDSSQSMPTSVANAETIDNAIKIETITGDQKYFSVSTPPTKIAVSYQKEGDNTIYPYPVSVTYMYNCTANYDTIDNTNNDWGDNNISNRASYNLKSTFDTRRTVVFPLQFYLNPTSFEVRYDQNNTGGTIIFDNNSLVLENNKQNNFYITIYPNKSTSDSFYKHSYPKNQDNRYLNLIVTSSDPDLVGIGSLGNSQSKFTIANHKTSFNIITGIPRNNSSSTATISLSLSYQFPWDNEKLFRDYGNIHLQQNFNINLIGDYNSCFFYAGFADPTSSTFNELEDFSTKNSKGVILWNWEDHVNLANANSTNDFYIVIPSNLVENIKPCWDIYSISNDGKTIYQECINRFEKVTLNGNENWPASYNGNGIGGKNIEMVVYKSLPEYRGLFYGKIQIIK